MCCLEQHSLFCCVVYRTSQKFQITQFSFLLYRVGHMRKMSHFFIESQTRPYGMAIAQSKSTFCFLILSPNRNDEGSLLRYDFLFSKLKTSHLNDVFSILLHFSCVAATILRSQDSSKTWLPL